MTQFDYDFKAANDDDDGRKALVNARDQLASVHPQTSLKKWPLGRPFTLWTLLPLYESAFSRSGGWPAMPYKGRSIHFAHDDAKHGFTEVEREFKPKA